MLLPFIFRYTYTWCFDGSVFIRGPANCATCVLGFVEQHGLCLPCSTVCATCSHMLFCLSCYNANILSEGACLPCHPSCLTCAIPLNSNACTRCDPPYKLSQGTCLQDTSCMEFANGECSTCPPGFFLSEAACLVCNERCLTCDGANFNDCTSCFANGKLVERQCLSERPCVSNCHTCDAGSGSCNSCLHSFKSGSSCQRCMINCRSCSKIDQCLDCFPGLVLSVTTCEKCHPTCSACSGTSQDQCTACANNKYLSTNNRCASCSLNCLACNQAGCLACNRGALSNGMCCATGCLGCTGPTISDCLNCHIGYTMINHAVGNVCTKCSLKCASCTSTADNACWSCYPNFYLKMGVCQISCGISYYVDTHGICQPCDSTCPALACIGPTPTGCLNPNSRITVVCPSNCGSCLTASNCITCKVNYNLINGFCCHTDCDTCGDSNGIYCLTCPAHFVPVTEAGGIRCDECFTNCSTCTASGSRNCLTCTTGLYFRSGYCKSSCGTSYYADLSKKCYSCHPSCLDCSGSASNLCTDCPNAYFLQFGSCNPCSTACADCTSTLNCLTCNAGTTLDHGLCCTAGCQGCTGSANYYCTSCTTGYIQVPEVGGTRCVHCFTDCATCDGPAISDCLTCSTGLFLMAGTCLSACDTSYYPDAQHQCQPCDSTCLECTGPTATECTSCGDYKYFETNTCQPCSFSCVICSSASACSTCEVGTVLSSGNCCVLGCQGCTNPTIYGCTDCSPGYFKSIGAAGTTCELCYKKCATCNSNAVNGCLTCTTGLYLKLGACQSTCGTWYYADPNLICQSCLPLCSCSTCSDGASCTAYVTGLWQDAIDQSCQVDCPIGQYQDVAPKCGLCASQCEKCNATNCFYCLNGYWLDLVKGTCEIQCPVGQHQSTSRGKCQFCSPACSACSRSGKCLFCANQYLSDRSGNCYRCNCGDCGVCPINCPLGTFYFKNNCYGICPAGSYRINQTICGACESPCAECQFGKKNCTNCQYPLLLHNNKCIKKCVELYYQNNQVCESCLKNGVFLKQYDECQAVIPSLEHQIECSSPSFPLQTITLKSTIPMSSTQPTATITIESQQSSCFVPTLNLPKTTNANLTELKLVISNQRCLFIHRKVRVTVSGVATALLGLFYREYTFEFDWAMGGGEVGSDTLFKLQKARQILKYGSLVPIVGAALPMMQAVSVLANVKNMPYQAYMVTSTMATQQIDFGCYNQQSFSNTLAAIPITGSRLLKQSSTKSILSYASSRLFFLDFLVSAVWIALGYLFLVVTRCVGCYHILAENVLFKLHEACLLLLCCSIVANNRDSLAGKFGLFAGVAFVAYYLAYWVYYASRLYCLKPDCQSRFELAIRLPVLLKKINWIPQRNEATGPLHILDPIYFRLLTQLINLAFYLTMVLVSNPIGQLSVLSSLCILNLVRLLGMPLFPCYINLLQAIPFCFLLVYAGLGFFSLQLTDSLQQAYNQQLVNRWTIVGWTMAAMVLGTVLSVIIKEAIVWCTSDSLEEVSLNQKDLLAELERDNTRREIALRMEQSTMRSAYYEIEKIVVVRDGPVFVLKSTAIPEIRSSMLKRFMRNEVGEFKNIVQRLMRVSKVNPIYWDLDRVGKDCSQFVIRTVGLFKDDQSGDQVLAPLQLYNVVTCGGVRKELRGKEQLAWTPLVNHS